MVPCPGWVLSPVGMKIRNMTMGRIAIWPVSNITSWDFVASPGREEPLKGNGKGPLLIERGNEATFPSTFGWALQSFRLICSRAVELWGVRKPIAVSPKSQRTLRQLCSAVRRYVPWRLTQADRTRRQMKAHIFFSLFLSFQIGKHTRAQKQTSKNN